MIDGKRLLAFVGDSARYTEDKASQAALVADSLVDAYTRGRHKRGGKYRPGVESVVLMVAARILANPEQVEQREQVGQYSAYVAAGFIGFTLAELSVLDRYRKRAL